jgi:hypothetical protein
MLELKNELSKVVGFMQKSVVILYINDEWSKKEMKKTTSMTITSKGSKYLGINLIQKVKYLYTESYKILLDWVYSSEKECLPTVWGPAFDHWHWKENL